MQISLYFLACALLLGGAAAQCSLCTNGSSRIVNANAALGGSTCAEMDKRAAEASNATCAATRETINKSINYSAFCCSDVSPDSNSCAFCNGINIDSNQAFPSEFSSSIKTCGQAKTLTQYISANEPSCKTITAIGSESCCKAPVPSPTRSPTTTRPPTRFPTPFPTRFPTLPPTAAPALPGTTSDASQVSMATLVVLGVSTWVLQG